MVFRNVYDYVCVEVDGSWKLRVYVCVIDFCLNFLILLKMLKFYEIEFGEVVYCIIFFFIFFYYECEVKFIIVIWLGDK